MRSHELAEILLNNPDCELIIQKDSEGNGYSPCSGIEMNVCFIPETTWSGEVASKDDFEDEEEWNDVVKKYSGFAVLYPIN